MLGHKADVGFMALGADLWRLRRLQSDLQAAGLVVADSYVSLTEVSEYAAGHPRRDEADPAVPDAAARGDDRVLLLPDVQAAGGRPRAPTGSPLPFEERKALMYGHGAVGRTFAGPHRPGHHRVDRHRRLGVGCDPVRGASRRPEGVRLHACASTRARPASPSSARSSPGWSAPVEEVLAPGRRRCLRVRSQGPAAGGPRCAACRAASASVRVVVAFSGGADSAFLAWVATDTLGRETGPLRDRRLAVPGPRGAGRLPGAGRRVGPAPPRGRDRRAGRPGLLGQRRLALLPLQGVADGGARSRAPGPVGWAGGAEGRSRPGPWCSASTSTIWATTAPGRRRPPNAVRGFPLVDAGFTKADVRAWSRQLGLRTWDKPAAACLASRVPYGTPVTLGTLRSVAEAESALRSLGLPPAPGPPLRRHRPRSRCRPRTWPPRWPAATRSPRPCTAPATGT